jgi:Icc protein
MFPFAWATDIHLDFLRSSQIEAFRQKLIEAPQNVIVITGDITNGRNLADHLDLMRVPGKTTYFVLGNHDFYHSSLLEGRRVAKEAVRISDDGNIHYLSDLLYPVLLPDGSYLIGVDGYADGRAGDFMRSHVWLNDYRLISEFRQHSKETILRILNSIGEESALLLEDKTRFFGDEFPIEGKTVYIATHAPPFERAHWYDGKMGDSHWMPHFVNVALGKAILAFAQRFPKTKFVVIAGHTHGDARVAISDNIECFIGKAVYNWPVVQNPSTIVWRG